METFFYFPAEPQTLDERWSIQTITRSEGHIKCNIVQQQQINKVIIAPASSTGSTSIFWAVWFAVIAGLQINVQTDEVSHTKDEWTTTDMPTELQYAWKGTTTFTLKEFESALTVPCTFVKHDYMINSPRSFILECGRANDIQCDNEPTLVATGAAAKIGSITVRHTHKYLFNMFGQVKSLRQQVKASYNVTTITWSTTIIHSCHGWCDTQHGLATDSDKNDGKETTNMPFVSLEKQFSTEYQQSNSSKET